MKIIISIDRLVIEIPEDDDVPPAADFLRYFGVDDGSTAAPGDDSAPDEDTDPPF